MATNNLLNQPTPGYRRFVDNQVLTDNQLNEVLDYLNHQDRLSRLLLQGAGIVCGLKISLNEAGNEIILTEGVALTTAGDLLKSGKRTFKGFKKFDDANVKYPEFTGNGSGTLNLWALEEDTSPTDVNLLNQFKSKTDVPLEQAVALLYFEDYLDEEKDCSSVDCDTQGQEVINRLRVLLVSTDDAQTIAEQDSIFSGFLLKDTDLTDQAIERHYVPRVMLNESNTKTFSQFKDAYDISLNDIADKIRKLSQIAIFTESLEKVDIDPASEIMSLSPTSYNYQYLYDFYRDLSAACNELQGRLQKSAGFCCPDPEAFPKHLLLGGFNATGKLLRHRFYPSPTHNKFKIGQLRSAFERILLMIKEFDGGPKREIKITPSRNDHYSLGKRAVPFYYNLDESDDPSEFIEKWNSEDQDLIPNYYGISYPGDEFNPLNVTLEGHDFYRVEGHTGTHVRDAHKSIQQIRDNKALPFKVMPVAIGEYPDEGMVDFEKYRVYFDDLQVVLEAWNEEQQCIVRSASTFLTGFSSKNPGEHTAYQVQEEAEEAGASDDFTGIVFQPEFIPLTYAQPIKTESEFKTGGKRAKKTRENQVLKSFSAAENSFGNLYFENVKTTHSSSDIFVNIIDLIPGILQNWNNEIVEAAVTIPGQLIGLLKEVEDYKLTDIEEFSEAKLKAYLTSLNNLCRKAKSSNNRLQQLMNKEESELKSKIWMKDYLFILNRIISSCCMMEKIKVLYQTILERKSELLSRQTLQQFIKDHPGAEHKAGAEKGGTFVLLYYSKNRKPAGIPKLEAAGLESLAGATIAPMRMMAEQPVAMASEALMSEFETVIPTGMESFMEIPEAWKRIRERIRFPGVEMIPHGTVVGDLCLPYVCCSDSPPATFVFPEQLATLRLPTDQICVDTEEGNNNPIPLTVVPAEGTVKAFIGKRELEDVIIVNENGAFFDTNKVSAEDFGATIRFEVNGQAVDPVLQIRKKPRAIFSISENVRFEKRNTVAVLSIKNSSEPIDELRFKWNINGEIIDHENATATATEFIHMLKVRPGEKLTVDVKLTAFNDFCDDSSQETMEIQVPGTDEPDNPSDPNDPIDPGDPIDPVNPVDPIDPIDPGEPIEPVEPVDKFDVILRSAGNNKIEVIKVIREITGLGLRKSKELVDSAPSLVQKGVSRAEAKKLKQLLERAGAKVTVK